MHTLSIDADLDLSVPSRLLDLLMAQGRLPERLELDRSRGRYRLLVEFTDLPADKAHTIASRIRQMPGVLTVEHGALAR